MKKLIINIAIKALNWIEKKNLGEFDRVLDDLIDEMIKKLKTLISKKK